VCGSESSDSIIAAATATAAADVRMYGFTLNVISAIVVTYRRGWALPYALFSLAAQARPPDEVVVVLKPSGDGSEEVVEYFSKVLPIRLVVQEGGGPAAAYALAIREARGGLILFIDDDAVAHEEWAARYEALFGRLEGAGGISGPVYRALLEGGRLVKTQEPFYEPSYTRPGPHREPLPEFSGYCGWIAKSGFMAKRPCGDDVAPSALLGGVNMAFRREAVEDCPLAQLYRTSRRAFWFESLLAYCARRRGFHTYVAQGPGAPSVWHIAHPDSLTRRRGFWGEFWIHYDRAAMYKRLKALGVRVSPWRYALALALSLRKRPLPRLLATLYALAVGY